MTIRAALASRANGQERDFERVPNAAIVPLDPAAAGEAGIGDESAPLSS
jgi:hypothetical protein